MTNKQILSYRASGGSAKGVVKKSVEILEIREEEGEIVLLDLDREAHAKNRLVIDTAGTDDIVYGYGRTGLDALRSGRRLSEGDVSLIACDSR